ncbi:MAG: PKD domain-containing protein, partial [Flavobacteriaceae bacterium]|nr:PKD domain-containing protein [Flavobacteriaceae bacterium]
ENPIAKFSIIPDSVYIPDEHISCFNYSIRMESSVWDFGDGSPPVSGVTNPTHTFPNDGIFTVTVTVNNPFVTPACGGLGGGVGFPQDFQIFKTPIDPLIDIVECDTDGSGSNDFDLSAIAANILSLQPSGEFFEVTFHTTQFNADNNLAPLNQANLLNLPLGQNDLFIRITNLDCAATYPSLVCHRVFQIRFTVVEDPIAGAVSDFVVCDGDGVNDGLYEFDLSIKDAEVLNGQPAAPFTITYHSSQADADNGVNPHPIPYNNVVNNEQVFVRIEATGQIICSDTTSFFLIVDDQPVANATANIEACDDITNDGTESIDLNAAITDIIGAQTTFPFSVTFHDSQADADSGANALPNPLDVNVGNRTVFARIENDNNSNCFDTMSFDIILSINPQIASLTDERLCDVGADGTENFDLTAKIPEILGAFNATDVNISFHSSQADADNNVNPLASPYANVTNPETIFVRMESQSLAQCFDTASFQLFVDEIPIAGTAANLPLCDIGNDQTEDVDLSAAFDTFILNGQNAAQFDITYHATQADADTGTNPLVSPFTVNQSTPTFFARIENVDNPECFDTTSFDIEIFDQPIANTVTNLFLCDDPSNDGTEQFDLNSAINDVLGTQSPTDFNVSFHSSQADADNNANPLPLLYDNVSNPETVFVRIENALNGACFDTTSFVLTVDEQPTAGVVDDFSLCDADNNGSEAIDLTTFDNEVINAQTGPFNITYYDSQADADNATNALPNTISVNAGAVRTVFARIENNNNSDCFDTTSFTIEVFVQPVANAVNDFVVCDNPGNEGIATFVLTNADTEVLGGQNPADFNITYHSSQADADNGVNALASPYNNVANPETIFVRIENVLSAACFDTTSFQLV